MSKSPKSERIEYLDYAKSIAIFMVLMCHRLLLKIHILGFAMPVFFIISGYTSKDQTDLRQHIKRVVKSFLVPYWIACAIYSVLDVFRAYAYGYSDWRIIISGFATLVYGSSYNVPVIGDLGKIVMESARDGVLEFPWLMNIMSPLNCHLWFLPVIFSGSIIFTIYTRYRKKNILIDILIIIGFILIGAIEIIPGMIQLPYGIGRAFPAAAYMIIGRIFKEKDIFNQGSAIFKTCISVVAATIGIFLGTKGYMNGDWNRSYYGPGGILGLFLSFIAGLLLVYAGVMLCKMIWLSPIKPLKYILDVFGRYTKPVYLWHLAIYFAADLIAVFIFHWQMTPEPYWVEIFSEGHLLYRWLVLFISWVILAYLGKIVSNWKKARFKKPLLHEVSHE